MKSAAWALLAAVSWATLCHSAHIAPTHKRDKMVEIIELMLSQKSNNTAVQKVHQGDGPPDYEVFITPTKPESEARGKQTIKIFVDAENFDESMMPQESRTVSQAARKGERIVPVLPLSIEATGVNLDDYQRTSLNKEKLNDEQYPSKRQTATTQRAKSTTRRAPTTAKEELPLSVRQETPSYVDQTKPYQSKDDYLDPAEEYTKLVLSPQSVYRNESRPPYDREPERPKPMYVEREPEPRRPVYSEREEDTRRPSYSEREDERRPVYETHVVEEPEPYVPRPSYEERVTKRPAYREPQGQDYESGNDGNRPTRQKPGAIYGGFPESHRPSNTGQGRPLQYEPGHAFPASPCHSVFQYEGREPESDRWHGNLFVTTEEVLDGMRIKVELDRRADLLATWSYEVKTDDNIQFMILALNKRLRPGPGETVRIMVKFNPTRPVPFVSSISLNGRRICPSSYVSESQRPTRRPVDRPEYQEPTRRTTTEYYELFEPETRSTTQFDRRTTESYLEPDRHPTTSRQPVRPNPNGVYNTGTTQRRGTTTSRSPPAKKTTPTPQSQQPTTSGGAVRCGRPVMQPKPLITKGDSTARGQWPWHAALYRIKGPDWVYTCGGSLISNRYVVTAAHCVTKTYDVIPLEADNLVVHLGKYHLKRMEGVQTVQVSEILVHPLYNSSDFKADLAVLELAQPVQFTQYVRPVCLWDKRNTKIEDLHNKQGTVIGWGYNERKELTDGLMQAQMPVVKTEDCIYSYREFFSQFTSNLTYCAGSRDGVSPCNGDSGGGMVFPVGPSINDVTWHLRGLVSLSVSRDKEVCDPKHYIIFTDIAQFLPWLENFV